MIERLSVNVGGKGVVFETGRIAKQAHGSVLVTQGDTMVLCAVCVSPEGRPGQDFFPLTVDYREKSSAAGKIPGNFFRREARPSEREVLVCRLIDRPIRPLFPKGFSNEVQVCSTVYSTDNEHNPDVLAINAASAALHISKLPFEGPIGAVRIGMVDEKLVINPLMTSEMEASALDLVIAGTKDAIIMVEGLADEVSEETLLEALEVGHAEIKKICACIEELRVKAGVEKMAFDAPGIEPRIISDVENFARESLKAALKVTGKHERQEAVDAIENALEEKLLAEYGEEKFEEVAGDVRESFSDLEKSLMRQAVIETSTRVDGRDLTTVRDISIEVGILPRAHGSCLFTRGETQALVTTTLGTRSDEQRLDELTGEEFRRFMLHYNFPPWSVGEVRRIAGPGRREIGHGKLAERALSGILPFMAEEDPELASEEDDFPYTIRVLSDITESNGSSSMATVCGGTMSLMDAGVPIIAPVAGVAMGLIKEGSEARVLTDILGVEDHLGDMDFKVCGTSQGITAFQMDVKIKGISRELMSQALAQAREARLHVLEKMLECLAEPRPDVSQYAPRIYTIKIDVEKIRDVIGPGGKVVRGIQMRTGAEINIEDDGTIHVASVDKDSADEALAIIRSITAEPEVGMIYPGTVSRILNFGAFVSFMGGKEGLVHISELAPGRINRVEDAVNIGDEINVKVVEIDNMGRLNLSKVQADAEMGRLSEEELAEMERSRGQERDRGRGDRDRGRGGRDRDRGGRDRDRGGSRGRPRR
ncbi:MAG TPA: polyribonucleotide nucleotidyltransferase [Candidatus Hydrogenedentes bacterium]|nr:polyribonucleotide nucleotidyltransferase [Candidatus Hydrogenedentota bacterium]HQH51712.1 polyribonucleotide nucleotidyltransferase [Candidatus Hydrogenedentota bacterium]